MSLRTRVSLKAVRLGYASTSLRSMMYGSTVLSRTYVSQTPSQNNTAVGTMPVMNMRSSSSLEEDQPPSSVNYLKTLSKKELFSLGMIGCVTLNKFTLDLAIKVFPFVPVFLIKWLISALYCGGDNAKEVRECGENLQKKGD